jgi:hypothetical protein
MRVFDATFRIGSKLSLDLSQDGGFDHEAEV